MPTLSTRLGIGLLILGTCVGCGGGDEADDGGDGSMVGTGATPRVGGTGGGGAGGGGVGVGGTGVGGVTATGGVGIGGTGVGGTGIGGTDPGIGGTASGGIDGGTGGTASGGTDPGTGGTATGGTDPGTGGTATGGAGTGGTSTGGAGTGGAGTGGAGTGGTSGGICEADYAWPTYSPNIAYDYFDEYGTIPKPTQAANDCNNVAGTYSDGWWTFKYGANKNSLVTSAAWIPMLQRLNTDFSYITDVMRWPRDQRVRDGYYSAVYLYGSGLCTDNASNTEKGGWQSSVGGRAMILASYYPVYSFDPACPYNDKVQQQGAMVHEGIHSILAAMPGCKNACWFHEGGNTWLQATMDIKRKGGTPTSMGFLSAGAAIAPFMPIESYSGWLQDGSFGGPCAERVNRFEGSQQICTWRNLLGGNQYGETFPHALEVILGEKSVAWVWRNANKSGRVLQDLAEQTGGLGPAQTKRLIQEYRARQAFGDFGIWSTAYKNLLNDNWNINIGPEWEPNWIDVATWKATPYAKTTQSGATLTPDPITLPGWSGANQIPLKLANGATCATVDFKPQGQNMSCQMVYRDTSGAIHYGTPVTSGECSVPVSNAKNGVAVAVITNTLYTYDGGTTKYGYTLDIGEGVASAADVNTKWYQ